MVLDTPSTLKKDEFIHLLDDIRNLLKSKKDFNLLKSKTKELSDLVDLGDKKIEAVIFNPPKDKIFLYTLVVNHDRKGYAIAKLKGFFDYIINKNNDYPENGTLNSYYELFENLIPFYKKHL